jgi:hypothetical protein
VYKAGPTSGLQGKEGKAVVLRDYTPNISLIPLKIVETEDMAVEVGGQTEFTKGVTEEVYFLCYEHNICLIEM